MYSEVAVEGKGSDGLGRLEDDVLPRLEASDFWSWIAKAFALAVLRTGLASISAKLHSASEVD